MAFHQHGPALLEVEAARTGSGTTVMPVGELDVATAEHLSKAVRAAAQDGEVTLDLSKLRFIDITGVRTVLELATELAGRLSVLPGPPHIHRVFEITGVDRRLTYAAFDNVTPFPGAAERNLKYVRRIWSVFARSGLEALIGLIPPDVEWQPWGAAGRTLHGSEELRDFYGELPAGGRGAARQFSSLGESVLVHAKPPGGEGAGEGDAAGAKELFSLYTFRRGTLQRATSYELEAEARAAAL